MRSRLFALLLFCATAVSADPSLWRDEWPRTDFSVTSIGNWSEVRSGGPPKDGIPTIDKPEFVPVSAAAGLGMTEAVITVELPGKRPRAYPLRYLIWHEIVNDRIGNRPVAVTYCPLCNSGLVFDRRIPGRLLSFGVSGKLRNSDMIMYDRETESWWQQATGEAIVGQLTGAQLTALPAWMEGWDQFRKRNPDGLVMAEPNFARDYGRNPYRGYDSARRPFLYDGALPPHGIQPLERVVRVGERAWPLTRLCAAGRLSEAGVVIVWSAGQASALDAGRVDKGRDIGSIRVTDSAGRDVVHDVMFAFAFHAFWPDGIWMTGR